MIFNKYFICYLVKHARQKNDEKAAIGVSSLETDHFFFFVTQGNPAQPTAGSKPWGGT